MSKIFRQFVVALLTVLLVYQTGTCPHGCWEHSLWYQIGLDTHEVALAPASHCDAKCSAAVHAVAGQAPVARQLAEHTAATAASQLNGVEHTTGLFPRALSIPRESSITMRHSEWRGAMPACRSAPRASLQANEPTRCGRTSWVASHDVVWGLDPPGFPRKPPTVARPNSRERLPQASSSAHLVLSQERLQI